MGESDEKKTQRNEDASRDNRVAYEAPKLMKKRSVSRVTLFSGGGATGVSSLTSS